MEGREGRGQAATAPIKRKHYRTVQQSHHHHRYSHHHTSKKRRLTSKNEISTLNHSRTNQFQSSRSSSRTNRKHKKQHRRTSAGTPGSRKWAFSTRDFSSYKDKVVFVSYNILGVENAAKHPDLYFNIPPMLLDWDHRKKLICKEINSYNPSILCFQEVDRFNDLDDLLQKHGFRGVYLPRTGEACDGCAIFWKTNIFTLMHQENIEFQSFGLRDNVAQFCVLKMIQDNVDCNVNFQKSLAIPSQNLLVGNIHVLFNPKRGDIKLGQIRLFLQKAHTLSEEWGNIPVIIAGDLNSMPQSAIYQFLASSELDVQLYDRKNISGQISSLQHQAFQSQIKNAASFWKSVTRPLTHRWTDEELRLATGSERTTRLRHNLKLCSAYCGIPGSYRTRDNYGEPLATSYHSQFMGTVDYIWHSEELVTVRVLETLPVDVLRQTGGLPSENWGSDHLALVCELAFAGDADGT